MIFIKPSHGLRVLTMAFFLSTLSAAFIFPFQAAAAETYLQDLLTRADKESLAEERYWHILLHYQKSLFQKKSQIDDPSFFLSPTGKTDPKAELTATIHSLFQNDQGDEKHSRCTFPARYLWLKEKLSINEENLPQVACPEFEETLQRVDPREAVLVFPSSFMNSPASMFGHTLLRIDSSYESKLLSYAVNYAARTTETNGLTFAFKGIFGFYNGYYSILPYYDKVKEYNNMDRRDIWEYSLDLNPDQVKRMFFHIWELREIYSNYYFFDENCSYNLLFLLEAANPSLHFTDNFFYWIIPVDTIKAAKNSGIIKDTSFRPSIASKIEKLSSSLGETSLQLALAIARGERQSKDIIELNIPEQEKIDALDLTTEVIQYYYSKRIIDKKEYVERFRANLLDRSTLGQSDVELSVQRSEDPIKGHGSARFSLGFGEKGDDSFSEIQFRPAYQTLFDSHTGYIEGGQIVFFDLALRNYEDSGLRVERFDLLDLTSLAVRGRVFKPLSWAIGLGMKTEKFHSELQDVYFIHPAVGLTYRNKWLGLVYFLASVDADFSEAMEDSYSLGLGGTIGVSKNINNIWKLNAYFKSTAVIPGEIQENYEAVFANNFQITTNSSISFSFTNERYYNTTSDEVLLTCNFYF